MPDFVIRNGRKIREAIEFLAAKRKPIAVKIEGESARFDSMIVKIDHGVPGSKTGTPGRLLIQWLSPAKGNTLIESSRTVQVRFSLGKHNLSFTSHYITKGLEFPDLGHMITYPESLVMADRRRASRHEVDSKSAPGFAKAKIRMRRGRSQQSLCDFGIFDVSERGVGILVGKELFNWLEQIGVGDRLEGVELSARWTIVSVDGTVRHKSEMRRGKYVGYQLLGIELDEKLEHYA